MLESGKQGVTVPPSTAYHIVNVPELYAEVIKRHGVSGTQHGKFVETLDVWWFINHYESYCCEHGLPINRRLYL
jgi:2,4'-dihydroxyacetophenone dioxygenase